MQHLIFGMMFSSLAFAAAANTSWYLKQTYDSASIRPFESMDYWRDENGNSLAAGTDFIVEDYYTITNDARVRLSGGTVFNGQQLTLGSDEGDIKKCAQVIHQGGSVELKNHGAVLNRGYWWFNSSADFTVKGKLTVFAHGEGRNAQGKWIETDSPFAFFYSGVANSNGTATVEGPIVGDTGTTLLFGRNPWSNKYLAPRQTMVLGDIDNYAGELVVGQEWTYKGSITNYNSGDNFGTCLRLPVGRPAASAAMVKVQVGGSVAPAASGVAKVDSIAFEEGSQLQVWGTEGGALGCVEATNTVTIAAKPLGVHWHSFVRMGEANICRDAILRAPLDKSDFTAEDFTLIRGRGFLNTDARLVVEENAQNNTRTLYVETYGFVYQVKCYDDEDALTRQHSSSLTNATHWSDGLVPHAGSRYVTATTLSTEHLDTAPYTFPGLSLWLQGGHLYSVASSFTVPELVLEDDARLIVCADATEGTHFIATNIVVRGSVMLCAHKTRRLEMDGPISGHGQIRCGSNLSTSAPDSTYQFNGDNSGYLGRMEVTMSEYRDENISLEKKHSTLQVNRAEELGGILPVFDYSALKLTHLAALAVTNTARTVVLPAESNRGLFAFEKAQFKISKNAVLDLGWPLTVRGQLWKRGEGTVILRGATYHLTADDGELTDDFTQGSNLLHVAEGTLRIANSDAFSGLKVDFAAGTAFELAYAPEGEFASRGIDLTKTDGVLELAPEFNGKLPWAIDAAGAEMPAIRAEMALATVKAADAEAYRAMLKGAVTRRTWPELSQRLVEKPGENDTVVFSVIFARRGTSIYLK